MTIGILELNALSFTLLGLGLILVISSVKDFLAPVTADNQILAIIAGRGTRVFLSVVTLTLGFALALDLSWMRWTPPTAVFFIGLFSLLLIMTVWDIAKPTGHPQGFLPIAFSRGERLFLGFMIFFGTMMLLGAFFPDASPWYGVAVAAVLIGIVARFG